MRCGGGVGLQFLETKKRGLWSFYVKLVVRKRRPIEAPGLG